MSSIANIISIVALSLFTSCGNVNARHITDGLSEATDTVSFHVLGKKCGKRIIIKDSIDLAGNACIIPKGMTLMFKGGCVKNGTLIGNATKINSLSSCFNRVRIEGSWNMPEISTSLFEDLGYDNALKDVFALSDSKVKNDIYIASGEYQVTAYKNGETCLEICDNTNVTFNGEIFLTPNAHRSYNIVEVKGKDIEIHGNGRIVGDRESHTGESGEWGMGIIVLESNNVTISGLTIKDCWGDCVYIGSNSKNVIVSDCVLDNGRRQGVSVTSGDNIVIRNCQISNIKGTSPEYAIDLEPNNEETVGSVLIEGCIIRNCRGGITTNGRAEGSRLREVSLKNCDISGITFHAPLQFRATENVTIEECKIDIEKIKFVFRFQDVNKALLRNNEITTKRFLLEPCSNIVLENNAIRCSGFYTEFDGTEIFTNISITGNKFKHRVPQMGVSDKSLSISIDNNVVE